MVIYGGVSDDEESQVKVEVPIGHKAKKKGHFLMVLQKVDWKKCSAVDIPEKANVDQ